jgi:hypothetical protein
MKEMKQKEPNDQNQKLREPIWRKVGKWLFPFEEIRKDIEASKDGPCICFSRKEPRPPIFLTRGFIGLAQFTTKIAVISALAYSAYVASTQSTSVWSHYTAEGRVYQPWTWVTPYHKTENVGKTDNKP